MLFGDYAKLEDDGIRVFRTPELDKKLILIRARNDLPTLALLRMAVALGRTAGLAEKDVVDQLACTPVAAADGQLLVAGETVSSQPKLVCFTSGSSGKAKGILRSYDSWLRTFELQRKMLRYQPDAGVLIPGNLAHSLHLFGAMEALERGVVPIVLETFSVKDFIDKSRDHRPQILYAAPAHLSLILAYGRKKPVSPLTSISHILAGGAKLDESSLDLLHALFPNAQIREFFGTSETSYITIKAPDGPPGSVGKPCPGVTLKIGDADGHPVATGREGLLWVKSDMLFERYVFGEDHNTKWRDEFLTIGDRGYLDDDRNLFFTARSGSMVTIAGENVFLDHIEQQLRSHVTLGEAVIVPVEDQLRGTKLVAATQIAMPSDQVAKALVSLRRQFGSLKSPKTILHIANWPFLPSGKTDRKKLEGMIAALR